MNEDYAWWNQVAGRPETDDWRRQNGGTYVTSPSPYRNLPESQPTEQIGDPEPDSGVDSGDEVFDQEAEAQKPSGPRHQATVEETQLMVQNPEPTERRWWRHANGRWVVEDEGAQPAVRAVASPSFRWSPPDTVIDGADVGRLTYRAASVRGLSHQESGLPRQDAYQVRFTQNQAWLVGCIADGVSQGRRSHEAAQFICDILTDTLVDGLNQIEIEDAARDWDRVLNGLPWEQGIDAANEAMVRRVREILRPAYEKRGDVEKLRSLEELPYSHARTVMSTTAMAFIVATAPVKNAGLLTATANIAGDSSAFVMRTGAWEALSAIKNEGRSIVSSAVRSMPVDAEVQPDLLTLLPGQALILMTDGLGDPLGSATGVVSEFLSERWKRPPDLLAFAQDLSFYRKSFTDDRTAVVIWAASNTSDR